MLKALRRTSYAKLYYHFVDGVLVNGAPSGVSGDLTGVSGDFTGVSGDFTGVIGNINDCGLTDEERKAGVHAADLIG